VLDIILFPLTTTCSSEAMKSIKFCIPKKKAANIDTLIRSLIENNLQKKSPNQSIVMFLNIGLNEK
jgi:hypothetical protein